jgi:hypothetical protein
MDTRDSIDWPRLRRACEIVDGIPDSHFNLNTFMSECGTIGCALGWLQKHPDFQVPMRRRSAFAYITTACDIFNMEYSDAMDLFGPVSNGRFPHKEIFRMRVRMLFARHHRPINPTY